MLTSKQRSHLRKLAMEIPDIIFIGKEGITPEVIQQTRDAIVARELIKGKIQQNSMEEAEDAARTLASAVKAEVVCTIGNKFILYKKNLMKTKIEVPSKNAKAIAKKNRR